MAKDDDDLTQAWHSRPPPGVRFGQGRITAWNPETFENQVRWRGITLVDVPVLAGPDALTFRSGDTVGMLGADPGGRQGAESWWILGRLLVPGPGAGANAVQFMTQALAKNISAEVFADRMLTAPTITTALPESTTSTSFTDLTTVGPTVSNVEVVTGTAMVQLGGALIVSPDEGAGMGFEITGATSRPADDFGGILALAVIGSGNSTALTTSALVIVDGLNVGTHQFRAKYKSDEGGSVGFNQRSLSVIGL